MQRRLAILQAAEVGVGAALQEHAAVGVVALDDSIAQQETVLDVDVGAVVQQDAHAAGALADDGQLQRGGALVAQRVHLGVELQQQPHKRVAPVVRRHVQRRPAVVALGVDDIAAVLRLQHEAGDARTPMHGCVVQRREAPDEVLHCRVSCRDRATHTHKTQSQDELTARWEIKGPSWAVLVMHFNNQEEQSVKERP